MSPITTPILPPGLRSPARRTITSRLLNDTMTYTHYSAETSGAYTQFTSTIGPGYANPPHYHTQFREIFTCTSGQLSLTLNGRPLALAPGESATVQIGDVHSLLNKSEAEDAGFTTRLEPGNEDFEKAMYVMHGLAEDGRSGSDGVPRNPVVLAVLAGLMDTWLAGWGFWAAGPLLAVARRAGQGWGVESELVARYWES